MKKCLLLLLISSVINTSGVYESSYYFFITGNPGKFKEIKEIVPEVEQLDIDLEEIQSTGGKSVIEAKVKEAFRDMDQKITQRFSKPFKSDDAKKNFTRVAELAQKAFSNGTARVIIEDTSLYFDAFANAKAKKTNSDDLPNGLPGPLIKWFDETIGNAGLYTMAQAFGNFGAKAVTWIGYSQDGKNIQYFKGEVPGIIVKPLGAQGFGWDPVFKPNAADKTFAEMTQAEKNKFSMRGMAAEQLRTVMEKEKSTIKKGGRVKQQVAQYEKLGTQHQ